MLLSAFFCYQLPFAMVYLCPMQILTPKAWPDYELIDTGGFEKLERFGQYILRRPEPQAVWEKALPAQDWDKCDAYFKKAAKDQSKDNERGEWLLKNGMPQQWYITYTQGKMSLKFRLGLTAFKHVGIFPEQAANWDYIFDAVSPYAGADYKVLNLFAYTGGASLAAKAAGADVTHVDAVKQVVTWSRENMEASKLDNIRWMVEDALKFVKREGKRGKKYNGIILDPPAYGRGPEGEKWVLEDSIMELLHSCKAIIAVQPSFLILNLYSMGFSALIADNLVHTIFNPRQSTFGELYLQDRAGRKLPLSTFARYVNF